MSRGNLHFLMIGYNHRVNFPQFLELQFLEWQRREGGRKTVGEFARHLGVAQTTVSSWWNGKSTPTDDVIIRRLADRLGLEVYDSLGLDRPDEDLLWIMNNWDYLPQHIRKSMKSLREQAEQYQTGRQNESKTVPKPRGT